MSKKLSLEDFRAVRYRLEPHEFAISEGQDVPPSNLVDEEVWHGIVRLPEDVSIRISDHNGTRLELLYSLWGDWITAVGDSDNPDEIFNCLLDAGDCFQCATFSFLHGFYRAGLAELRTSLELVMIGVYGNLHSSDAEYQDWKSGDAELGFTRCRKKLLKTLDSNPIKWMFGNDDILARTYRELCGFTHSRPGASDGALWQSNGPVFNNEAIRLTFVNSLLVFALCHLLIRVARPDAEIPEDSNILFELDWMPDYSALVSAHTELFGKAPKPPMK